MLESIRLVNFKVARDLEFPLANLTLLSGLNGSGKSSVLQAIALLRQSYRYGQAEGLVLSGPLVPLGQGADVLSEGATNEEISISFTTEGEVARWVAHVPPDASQLPLREKPSILPSFVSSPSFQYLQANRTVPSILYPQTDLYHEGLGFLGNHGEFTVDFLACHGNDVVSEKRRVRASSPEHDALLQKVASTSGLIDQVAGWLQEISPGIHLQAERLKRTDNVLLSYRYLGLERGRSRDHRPTHVGFGLTYSLPILVAALSAPVGSLLLLENPEAHLHPHGQAKLGELLAACANDGIQIIVETHSDHLLNGARVAVKKGHVPAHAVQAAFFTREVSSGDTFVELPVLLENGQMSNWPSGFFDEWEIRLNELLK